MTGATPTRSAVLEMKEERRAMRDGHAFLDEKCLLLAGEMLKELGRYASARREFVQARAAALDRLREAVARHGLGGLQAYPAADAGAIRVVRAVRTLMGVSVQEAALQGSLGPARDAIDPSPEAEACRNAFAALIAAALPLAAVAGNLERLALEYRRSVRRARALQDVLLPELDRDVADSETRLEELEQEDAIFMRKAATT